ncbi:MAG: AAA family ATPase [Bacteroidota bacterium]
MLKIPYGISNFKTLIKEGYFYQDKTAYLELLETLHAQYFLFLRPRRFGKSLFISTLEYYYGLEYAVVFEDLFASLYIGKNRTQYANQYLILSLEFARIDTQNQEQTKLGFLSNVKTGVSNLLHQYPQFFDASDIEYILVADTAEEVMKRLFANVRNKQLPHQIYLLIDEYDHFANELIAYDLDYFKSIVSQNGFVRKFYESLKRATQEGVLGRIFITGVSPITLDSLTSGFNIVTNLTTDVRFHHLMGFSKEETTSILQGVGANAVTLPKLMADLQVWYNGYLFSHHAKERLYNTDMVLYFANAYAVNQQYPDKMLDVNIASSYHKISQLSKINDREEERLVLLRDILEGEEIEIELTYQFNFEKNFTDEDFLSLLLYLGLLTIKSGYGSNVVLQIPNYVIKQLYFEYFAEVSLRETAFSSRLIPVKAAIKKLVFQGEIEPFINIVETVLKKGYSNRDAMNYDEKHLKTLIISLLFPYNAYIIHSEYEADKAYPDIFLERIPQVAIQYEVLIELKYLNKKQAKNETLFSRTEKAAKDQLTQY